MMPSLAKSNRTLAEIGPRLGVSHPAVQQILAAAQTRKGARKAATKRKDPAAYSPGTTSSNGR